MAVASATECGLTSESENNACMIMALMPSPAAKAMIQKIILTNKYNRENDLYKFSKRNVHFSHFFAVRLPA